MADMGISMNATVAAFSSFLRWARARLCVDDVVDGEAMARHGCECV